MERTLVLLKPDAILRRQVGVDVLKSIEKLENVSILAFKEDEVPESVARAHYAEHEEKPFFLPLIDMITLPTGICALILEGEGVVSKVRTLLGPTFIGKAKEEAPDSLRGRYGVWQGINVAHASDSPESGARETDLWQKKFGLKIKPVKAVKAVKNYIKRWDGKFPEHSDAIQSIGRTMYEEVQELVELIKEESDVEENEIKTLISILTRL